MPFMQVVYETMPVIAVGSAAALGGRKTLWRSVFGWLSRKVRRA